jgi:hypothetical protein
MIVNLGCVQDASYRDTRLTQASRIFLENRGQHLLFGTQWCLYPRKLLFTFTYLLLCLNIEHDNWSYKLLQSFVEVNE